MAARSSRDADSGAQGPRRGFVPLLTLLLALYAAGAATVLLFRSPQAPPSAVVANVSPELRAVLDEQARTLRGEIAGDLKKSVQETKDQVNEAVRRLDERSNALQSLVDAGKRSADGLVKAASTRAEVLEDRIKDLNEKNVDTRGRIDALQLQVRELERRPAAPAVAAAPAPSPEAATPKPPEPAEAPKGPTPEQIAANKERVRTLITALDGDLRGALPAATELGRLGDLDAVDPLVKFLQHRDIYARQAAADALGALKACDGVPALIQALLDKDPSVAVQAGIALRHIIGLDSGLSAESSRRDRNDARDRALKFWRENETAVRERLGQPARVAEPEEPGK
jgi:HEAT repeat protein